jgi:hypothetical protein
MNYQVLMPPLDGAQAELKFQDFMKWNRRKEKL